MGKGIATLFKQNFQGLSELKAQGIFGFYKMFIRFARKQIIMSLTNNHISGN
jgi:hypothetical protein